MVDWKDKLPWDLIREEAKNNFIDPYLVAAIIQVESSGNAYAVRYEPSFRYRCEPYKYARINNITEQTENLLQSCSIGLMQVMGCVARELGFKGNLMELIEPELGIEYGCKKLGKLSIRHGKIEDVIAAYNTGSVLYNSNGQYRNQTYVNKVMEKYRELNAEKKL